MLSSILLSALAVSLAAAAPSPSVIYINKEYYIDSSKFMSAAWYPGWIPPFENGTFPITWHKYSLISWAFALPTDVTSVLSLDESGGSDLVHQFVTQAHANNVTAGITVGGWTGSRFFSYAVGSPENRTEFVKAVNQMVEEYDLDAVDFDWEFPNKVGLSCNKLNESDSDNFLAFLQELRRASPKENLHISAAVSIAPFIGSDGNPMTNVSEFANVLDHIAIMAYDIGGQWSNLTGPNAPLDDSCSSVRTGSATGAVEAWTKAGFPREKIILGVPAYGHSFNVTTSNAINGTELVLNAHFDKIGNDTTPDVCNQTQPLSDQHTFSAMISEGFLDNDGNHTNQTLYQFDNCSQTPFLYHQEKQLMIYYDDVRSFAAKGKFITDKNLAGSFMWDVTGDHGDLLINAIHSGAGVTSEC